MKEMVSVIVPTFNREKVIDRAIRSILRQTYEWYEIIIVDDGSSDHTQDVVQQIESDRIRYLRLEQNRGAGHARNVGIQEAQYDYIAFLDSDDEWFPEKLERQMKKMLCSDKETGLVYCRMAGCERNSTARYVCPSYAIPKDILEGNMFRQLLLQNVIGTPTMLVKKECINSVGGFKEALRCLEDWELVIRIARDWKIGFVDEVLMEVYKVGGSISTNLGTYLLTRCYLVSLYRQEMEKMGALEAIKDEILQKSKGCDLYEEVEELLNRDFRL